MKIQRHDVPVVNALCLSLSLSLSSTHSFVGLLPHRCGKLRGSAVASAVRSLNNCAGSQSGGGPSWLAKPGTSPQSNKSVCLANRFAVIRDGVYWCSTNELFRFATNLTAIRYREPFVGAGTDRRVHTDGRACDSNCSAWQREWYAPDILDRVAFMNARALMSNAALLAALAVLSPGCLRSRRSTRAPVGEITRREALPHSRSALAALGNVEGLLRHPFVLLSTAHRRERTMHRCAALSSLPVVPNASLMGQSANATEEAANAIAAGEWSAFDSIRQARLVDDEFIHAESTELSTEL